MLSFCWLSVVILLLCAVFLTRVSGLRVSNVGNYQIRSPVHVYKQKLDEAVSKMGSRKTWEWKGKNINYIEAVRGNTPNSKSPLLLIHGAVAPSFHWRNNIPALSEKYNVYAIDLLGFGQSDKPRAHVDKYTLDIWTAQVLDFIQEVIRPTSKPLADGQPRPCVVAGTCLGGSVALAAAASQISKDKELISGCVLLNAHCKFLHGCIERPRPPRIMGDACDTHGMVGYLRKQYVLGKPHELWDRLKGGIYRYAPECVDDNLVECIREQMESPDSFAVWNRVLEAVVVGSPLMGTDDMLEALTVPLLLLWGTEVKTLLFIAVIVGPVFVDKSFPFYTKIAQISCFTLLPEQDEWISPRVADRLQLLYPQAQRLDLEAGHCPHDEKPEQVNAAIDSFTQEIVRKVKAAAKKKVKEAEAAQQGV